MPLVFATELLVPACHMENAAGRAIELIDQKGAAAEIGREHDARIVRARVRAGMSQLPP